MGKIGVLAWPAFSTKEGKPYNYILYNNIRSKGCDVYEFNFSLKNVLKYSLSFNYQIFHIHWPTHVFFGKSELKARIRLKILFLFINLIKSSGRKVVWMVHNLDAFFDACCSHKKLQLHMQRRSRWSITMHSSSWSNAKEASTRSVLLLWPEPVII